MRDNELRQTPRLRLTHRMQTRIRAKLGVFEGKIGIQIHSAGRILIDLLIFVVVQPFPKIEPPPRLRLGGIGLDEYPAVFGMRRESPFRIPHPEPGD